MRTQGFRKLYDASLIALAKELAEEFKARGYPMWLRAVAAELETRGHVMPSGESYLISEVATMISFGPRYKS